MRTSHRQTITRLSSTLIAIALLGGVQTAHAAARKGKGTTRAAPSKDTSSSRAASSPSSSSTETEGAPAVTETTEKSAPAAAADPFAEGGSEPAASAPPPAREMPPSAVPVAAGARPTDDPPEPAAPSAGGGIIERMPASAFPEPYTRGLFGGSLWLTMHGQQWPYYPRTGIGVSGYAWVDTAYAKTRIGDPGQPPHLDRYIQQGRAVLRVTPTYSSGDWFVQAQVELVGNKDQTQTQTGLPAAGDTDDMWVRTGLWKTFDITVGRFEAFEVYHLGMGLDLNTFERIGAVDSKGPGAVPQIYGASYLFYRPNGPGNIAAHVYLGKSLRLEGLGQWGNDTFSNTVGGRGAAVYDIGWLKVKGAYEYVKGSPPDPSPAAANTLDRSGWGVSAQLVLAPWVELGVNVGKAIFDLFGTTGHMVNNSGDTMSVGGFVNARPFPFLPGLLIGGGWNRTKTTVLAETNGMHDVTTNTQAFGAIQYLVGGQLFIKLVGGYARTDFSTPSAIMEGYENDQLSVRLRFQYLF
jgi:hypothetical protein